MRFVVAILAFVLTGCVFGKHRIAHDNTNPAGPWGYYSGNIDTRWDQDGRTMTLLNELRYTDPKGVVWVAPAGSVIDGASIPRALWSFMGGPFEGKYRNASVLHDVAYDQRNKPPPEVDRMFLQRHALQRGRRRRSQDNVLRAAPVRPPLEVHGEESETCFA